MAMLSALVVLGGWHPEVAQPVLIALCAALPATLAELFSRRLDDNFSIPVTAALGAWLGMLALA